MTAISFHAYPYLQENYTLMGCGGSVGEGYGPMIVSTRQLVADDLSKMKIAVPGTLTTAYLALKIFNPAIWRPDGAVRPDHSAGDWRASTTRA